MRLLALLGGRLQVTVFKRENSGDFGQFTVIASGGLVLAPDQESIFHKVIPRICG